MTVMCNPRKNKVDLFIYFIFKLRINDTFRQQMAFFPIFNPILSQSSRKVRKHGQWPFLSVSGLFLAFLVRTCAQFQILSFSTQARRFRCHLGSCFLLSS